MSVHALVDEDRFMSAVPASLLRKLGISASRQQNLRFPDGSVKRMDIGEALVRVEGQEAPTQIVFNDEGTQPILGRLTISGLLMTVDRINERLVPIEFIPAHEHFDIIDT